jgi:hypothetical protein
MFRILSVVAVLTFAGFAAFAQNKSGATVVEIATMTLAEGITPKEFAMIDKQVEVEHVSRQPGFVARETGATEGGWVAIVYWESIEDAQASMDSFATAPAASDFMSMVKPDSIKMTRYALND